MSHATTPARTTGPERRQHARGARAACSADRCRQGHAPCPCPQACEIPAPDQADPLHEEPATAMEVLGLVLGVLLLSFGIALLVHACARA